jgi:phage anti-repressor protein
MTTEEETKKTLNEADLANFTGTEQWYKHWLGPVYTEGVKYLAEHAGAFWLIDSIVINQTRPKVKGEEFQAWKLKVDLEKHTGVLTCDDGNGNIVYTEKVPFTDFPLPEITIWYTNRTLLLPSEY